MNRLGYPCINMTLKENGITTSRSLKLNTLKKEGFSYYQELVIKNLDDLFTILQWNEQNSIKVFRISNNLFSHRNQFRLHQLSRYKEIFQKLTKIGNFVKDKGHRLSFHADHYSVLASQKDYVTENAIQDINFFSDIFDHMGFEETPYHKINVHVSTSKPLKEDASRRFIEAYKRLNNSAQRRITVENDDKIGGFSVKDLYDFIYKKIKIPIVFDYLHHDIHKGGIYSTQKALNLALSTWANIKPIVHYSSSRRLFEEKDARPIAHADYVYEEIPTYGKKIDIMLESKAKELALLEYKQRYESRINN